MISQNCTGFTWSKRRERAALLVAKDEETDEQIAAALKITRRTLAYWKRNPAFAARVQEHRDRWRRELAAKGLVEKRNRVDALNERWEKMRQIIAERAEDEDVANVAGGKTGLIIHRMRVIGTGKNAQLVDEYEVDTGLLKELRAHEEQAAKELGQWVEKGELTGKDGGPIQLAARVEIYIPSNGRDDRDSTTAGAAGSVPSNTG